MLGRSAEEIFRPASKSWVSFLHSMQCRLSKELMLGVAKGAAIEGSGLHATGIVMLSWMMINDEIEEQADDDDDDVDSGDEDDGDDDDADDDDDDDADECVYICMYVYIYMLLSWLFLMVL